MFITPGDPIGYEPKPVKFSARHAVLPRRENVSDAKFKNLPAWFSTAAIAGDADDVRSAMGFSQGAKYRGGRDSPLSPVGGASLPHTRRSHTHLTVTGQRPGQHSREHSSRHHHSPGYRPGQFQRAGQAPSSVPISDISSMHDAHVDTSSGPTGSRFWGEQTRESQHRAQSPSVNQLPRSNYRGMAPGHPRRAWEVPSAPPPPVSPQGAD
jgi:hypothetical protein